MPIADVPLAGGSFDVAAYYTARENEARDRLRTTIPEWVRLGCQTDDVVTTGRPYVEILRAANERPIDLIVMGVHGRNAIKLCRRRRSLKKRSVFGRRLPRRAFSRHSLTHSCNG